MFLYLLVIICEINLTKIHRCQLLRFVPKGADVVNFDGLTGIDDIPGGSVCFK